MVTVGIKTLKNKLSEYIRLVRAGETVLILDRDRVVAELGPPRASRERTLPDVMLAQAAAAGLISPAMGPLGPPSDAPPAGNLRDILAGLEADRQDR